MPSSVLPLPAPAQPVVAPPVTDSERLDRLIAAVERLTALAETLAARADPEPATIPLPEPGAQLIDQAELAEILKVKLRTVRRMEARGELPPSGLSGRKRTYCRDEINRWLRAGRPKRDEWVARGRH